MEGDSSLMIQKGGGYLNWLSSTEPFLDAAILPSHEQLSKSIIDDVCIDTRLSRVPVCACSGFLRGTFR